jgi:hypothetical protein
MNVEAKEVFFLKSKDDAGAPCSMMRASPQAEK